MKWFKKFLANKYTNTLFQKVQCPVCLHKFYMADSPFRCGNTLCQKEPDTVVEEVFSLKTPPLMGKIFPFSKKHRWKNFYKEWRGLSTCKCPSCKEPSSQRLCPSCHTPLPIDFRKHPTYLILLIGSEKSGKSAYLDSLLKRLKSIAADGYNFTFSIEQMYTSPWQPSIFRYQSAKTGDTKAFVTFFELSGKSLESPEGLRQYQKYLERADGLFVFLDPATFPGIGGVKRRLSEKTIETLTTYLNKLKALKKRAGYPPTSFIITKMDLLINLLPKTSMLHHDTEPKGFYNEEEGYQVSREVRGYLGAWSGPEILQTIICNYLRDAYRFFAIACDNGKGDVKEYAPMRVEEPFLWLFQQLNGDGKEE